MTTSVDDLPFAYGGPSGSGDIRCSPEDFMVDEIPVMTADGRGEHCLLRLQKRGSNTDWVAGQLARLAGVPRRDVGHAGLKDRNAVTRQWFSVRLAGKPEPDWTRLESDHIKVLEVARHSRKLRVGALRGNRFRIRVRNFIGDPGNLRRRLQQLENGGMPNYFGEQRFGHQGANLAAARDMFSQRRRVGRQQRSYYLSAVRAMLFNQVLATRVAAGSWNCALPGERLVLEGTRSSFVAATVDDDLLARLRSMDLHPSGPLYGLGEADSSADAAAVEAAALVGMDDWLNGLRDAGLKSERRPLRAVVGRLRWTLQSESLQLEFSLPRGSYATVMLRECLIYRAVGLAAGG